MSELSVITCNKAPRLGETHKPTFGIWGPAQEMLLSQAGFNLTLKNHDC